MKVVTVVIACLLCLLMVTGCPARLYPTIVNQSSETIDIMLSNGKVKATLRSNDAKKVLFPVINTMNFYIHVRVGNTVFTYDISQPFGELLLSRTSGKIVFHEDRKFYLIPYDATWDDALKNTQPEGWPVAPETMKKIDSEHK